MFWQFHSTNRQTFEKQTLKKQINFERVNDNEQDGNLYQHALNIDVKNTKKKTRRKFSNIIIIRFENIKTTNKLLLNMSVLNY